MPSRTFFIGSGTPIRPVDATSTSLIGNLQRDCGNAGHFFGVAESALPVQALALPELIDDRAGHAAFDPLDANFYRRGANLIRRECASNGCGRFGNDQREVRFQRFVRTFARAKAFDVAKNAGSEKPLRGDNGTVNCFELEFFHQPNDKSANPPRCQFAGLSGI